VFENKCLLVDMTFVSHRPISHTYSYHAVAQLGLSSIQATVGFQGDLVISFFCYCLLCSKRFQDVIFIFDMIYQIIVIGCSAYYLTKSAYFLATTFHFSQISAIAAMEIYICRPGLLLYKALSIYQNLIFDCISW